MKSLTHAWLLALTITAAALGCRTSAPTASADPQLQTLEQRVSMLQGEAAQGGRPTPAQQGKHRQLVGDIRAWQQRTGSDELQVTQESETIARRADGRGSGGCEPCSGYLLDGDSVCFLEIEECPADEGGGDDELTFGTVCVYSCIWIGSGAAPAAASRPGAPLR